MKIRIRNSVWFEFNFSTDNEFFYFSNSCFLKRVDILYFKFMYVNHDKLPF